MTGGDSTHLRQKRLMVRRIAGLVVSVAVLGVGAWACAVGYSETPPDEPGGGGSEADSGKVPVASSTSTPDSGKVVVVDSGVSGGDGGTTSNDSGPPPSCNPTNTCMGATVLPQISGDTGGDVRNATGEKSEWFQVRVTEDDSSLFGGVKLKAKIDLTSTPSSNYDLFVYVPGSDTRECALVTRSSTSTGTTDTASVEWGEGAIPNGSDDSRPITIEVRHVSGLCDSAHKWTLKVTGNN